MKLAEAVNNPINLTPQQVASIRQAMARMTPFELTKLVKDLEDIQRGGSDWRKKPNLRGYG